MKYFYTRLKLRKWIFLILLTTVMLQSEYNLTAQCQQVKVVSRGYINNLCGMQHQGLYGVDIPIYGKSGNLLFTSPLTENVKLTNTSDLPFKKLFVYPNPAIETVNIQWEENEKANIELLTPLHQLITTLTTEPNQITTLDVSDLPNGFYLIKIKSSNNQIYISKLIKQ